MYSRQLTALMYTSAMPASSSHVTGVPGAVDRYAVSYSALKFFTGLVYTWSMANNSAIMAEVRSALSYHCSVYGKAFIRHERLRENRGAIKLDIYVRSIMYPGWSHVGWTIKRSCAVIVNGAQDAFVLPGRRLESRSGYKVPGV